MAADAIVFKPLYQRRLPDDVSLSSNIAFNTMKLVAVHKACAVRIAFKLIWLNQLIHLPEGRYY